MKKQGSLRGRWPGPGLGSEEAALQRLPGLPPGFLWPVTVHWPPCPWLCIADSRVCGVSHTLAQHPKEGTLLLWILPFSWRALGKGLLSLPLWNSEAGGVAGWWGDWVAGWLCGEVAGGRECVELGAELALGS